MKTGIMVAILAAVCGCATERVGIAPAPGGDGGMIVARGVWGRAADTAKESPVLTAATVLATGAAIYFVGDHNGWWGGDSDGDSSRAAATLPPQYGDRNVQISVVNSQNIDVRLRYESPDMMGE